MFFSFTSLAPFNGIDLVREVLVPPQHPLAGFYLANHLSFVPLSPRNLTHDQCMLWGVQLLLAFIRLGQGGVMVLLSDLDELVKGAFPAGGQPPVRHAIIRCVLYPLVHMCMYLFCLFCLY